MKGISDEASIRLSASEPDSYEPGRYVRVLGVIWHDFTARFGAERSKT